ncbi:putative Carboxylic ester hydrolase [Seiridium cardinale]|uniref:Carboxylic ester hydrolase n=1 Tax=Seiridium cardinale TaxID=138064 RepID=A0ABR2XG92_9PEZI
MHYRWLVFSALFIVCEAVLSTVTIGCNSYTGVNNSLGVTQWLGVRYAAPPLGNLRFSPPQDPPCSSINQSAATHGNICLSTGASISNSTGEDCLFMDIFAPSRATTRSQLPVFFFIQGGGFNGDANPNIDGTGLIKASNDSIIVVNFNYRVGVYGFLADGDAVAPNIGLLDQRKAMEFVQNYISVFGGDPDHVVIGGDSAGAASISLHLTAYGGEDKGLFHAAAAESIPFATVLTANQSRYQYENFVISLGCVGSDPLACLKSKTTAEIQAHGRPIPYPGEASAPAYMWGPVIDGDMIRDVTYKSYSEGKFVRVPLLAGDDSNGGTVFAPRSTATLADSNSWLKTQFPRLTLEQLATINGLYPWTNQTFSNSGAYWRQLADTYGEGRFMCPTIYVSSAAARYGTSGKSWNYRYNVMDPVSYAAGYGVPHTVELSAILGPDYDTPGKSVPTSYYPNGENELVSPVIQAYWTSFIRTFDPNTYRYPGAAEWQPWSLTQKERLLFQTGGGTVMENLDEGLQERCSYWYLIGESILQ